MKQKSCSSKSYLKEISFVCLALFFFVSMVVIFHISPTNRVCVSSLCGSLIGLLIAVSLYGKNETSENTVNNRRMASFISNAFFVVTAVEMAYQLMPERIGGIILSMSLIWLFFFLVNEAIWRHYLQKIEYKNRYARATEKVQEQPTADKETSEKADEDTIQHSFMLEGRRKKMYLLKYVKFFSTLFYFSC